MGGQQCKQISTETLKKSEAYGLYELVIERNHQYAVITKSISKNSTKLSQLKLQLQKRKKIQSSNLVNLCNYELRQIRQFFDIKLYYQHVPLTLAQRVQSWKMAKRKPTQSEISNLILGIESALKQLYLQQIGHRCVNFETILCWQSLYKLTDISMLTFLTAYDFERQGDKKQLLSTSLLNYLYYQGTEPKYRLEDDLFSLGMIIIAIVLECTPQSLYFFDIWKTKKVNMKKLQEGKKILKALYKPWIERKVQNLLQGGIKNFQETPKKSTTSLKDTYSVL